VREELRAALRSWLALVALFYPCYFVSQFAVNAAPALVKSALAGERLETFDVGWLGVRAVSVPASPPPEVSARRNNPWLLALALGVVVALVGRRHPQLSGLLLALFGQAAFQPWARRILLRGEWTAETLLPALLPLLLTGLGLRWMAAGERWWLRLALPCFGFLAPWALLWRSAGVVPRGLLPLLPACGVAVLAALPRTPPRLPIGRRWVLAGLAASAVLVVVVHHTGPALRRAAADARRQALAAAPPLPAHLPYAGLYFHKGVNFTAEWPDVYGSLGARQALEALPRYGVNAVALVPYGFASREDPRIAIPGSRGSWESDEGVEYLSRIAHQLGVRVLLKPQLWVGGRSYPGELEFRDDAARRAWFEQYRRFVEHYARLAARIHADVLCIGVELIRMTPYEREWRGLIARARELYPGPLVYAANWGAEFESVAFWDALDYIGLNNYYPLPDDLATAAVVARIEAVQRRAGRPVIFTEAGFSSYESPHRRPWDESPRRISLEDQARCYEAVFRAFYERPWFAGMYWWKVGTNRGGGPSDGSHTPWGKPAMQVVARWYLGNRR
jgi:hypothetical protein